MTTMTYHPMCRTCQGEGTVTHVSSSRYGGIGGTVMTEVRCTACNGTGSDVTRTITVEVEEDAPATPAVTPAPAGTLVVGGVTVHAPGFVSAAQFDAAVHRAYCEGLTVRPAATRGTVLVTNPTTHRAYLTTRTSCTCAAGRQGRACKHQSFAIHLSDVCGEDITRPQVAA